MIVTNEIRLAIKQLIIDIGGVTGLIEQSGLSRPTAYHIASAKCHIIQDRNWQKIQPLIAPYLETIEQSKGSHSADSPSTAKGPLEASKSDSKVMPLLQDKLARLTEEQLEQVLVFVLSLPKE